MSQSQNASEEVKENGSIHQRTGTEELCEEVHEEKTAEEEKVCVPTEETAVQNNAKPKKRRRNVANPRGRKKVKVAEEITETLPAFDFNDFKEESNKRHSLMMDRMDSLQDDVARSFVDHLKTMQASLQTELTQLRRQLNSSERKRNHPAAQRFHEIEFVDQ